MLNRMSKCTYHKYGQTGSVEQFDVQCLLPYNEINEKIYIFLYFYFFILTGLTICYVICLIMIRFVPATRKMVLSQYKNEVENMFLEMNFSDFVLIYLVTKNLHKSNISRFLDQLSTAVMRKSTTGA